MSPQLPETLDSILRPLFEEHPLGRAMGQLVVAEPADPGPRERVERMLRQPPLDERPDLAAGLWLYVDELDRSHRISQGLDTPTGSFWHAIMHRREGDFDNSRHWYRRTGKHPAMNRIQQAGGGAGAGTTVGRYDAHELVDRVERAHAEGGDWPELVSLQRREWIALFEHCAEQ